jgi:hypothetical protein
MDKVTWNELNPTPWLELGKVTWFYKIHVDKNGNVFFAYGVFEGDGFIQSGALQRVGSILNDIYWEGF